MGKQLVQYVFNLNKCEVESKKYSIVNEFDLIYRFIYDEEPHILQKNHIGKLKENSFCDEIFVFFVEDDSNEFQNLQVAKELFTNYINNCQKENENRYYEETTKYNNCLHAIENTFSNKISFVDEIKKQAINCKRMLSVCDSVDCLLKLNRSGYEGKIMVDIDDNGLIPLKQYLETIDLGSVTFDYNICRIQLETYENLGAVFYDFKEDKLYFSVFKGDEEYAIIEDTTLETLEDDYQEYLDKKAEMER